MKGFTLVEIVVSIVLVGVMTVALGNFMNKIIDTYRFVDIRNEIAYQAKKLWIGCRRQRID